MPTLVVSITLFVLALLIGIEVIGKVPATLHTPLMSGANSIHGIVIAGVVIVAAHAHIGLEANRPAALRIYLLAELFGSVLCGAVVYQNAEAVFCKGKSRRTAYAAGSSGYYHVFVSYTHFTSPGNPPPVP